MPLLRPVDATLGFAAPICDSSVSCGQSRLIAGCAMEANVSSDIIVTSCASMIAKYISGLTGPGHSQQTSAPPPKSPAPSSSHPMRLLLTSGLVRYVLWDAAAKDKACWDLLTIDIIQPHLLYTPEVLDVGLNDLQVSCAF